MTCLELLVLHYLNNKWTAGCSPAVQKKIFIDDPGWVLFIKLLTCGNY